MSEMVGHRECWNFAAGKAEANKNQQQYKNKNKRGQTKAWSQATFAGRLQHLWEKRLPFLETSERTVWSM